MKHRFTLFLALLFFSTANAQITITQNDFADANDTVRMSVAVWNPFLDFGATGANHTWDFSDLQWQSQYVDTFFNPLFTRATYALTYSNTFINPFRANIAKKEDNALTTFPFLSNIFSDNYNFYYKSQTFYAQKGMGMRVSAFPTSVPMFHFDTIYRFPMHFGDEDSSHSDYSLFVPQMGFFAHQQKRVNKVDGWGTLTTPFGTFDVLRQVSEIRASDSLYIDTLNFGFNINADIQREYKWIANGEKVPLLQINTQTGILGQFQNFEFITKIIYRDSVRFELPEPTGISSIDNELQFQIFPNPTSGNFVVLNPAASQTSSLQITDVSGRIIFAKQNFDALENIDASAWARGIYFVTLRSDSKQAVRKVVIE